MATSRPMADSRRTSFVAGAVAWLAACTALAAPERTLLSEPPRVIADFTLTNSEGKAVRLSELRGAPVLVFFGFSHCPTVCPVALQELKQLQRQHAADLGPTRILVISVDGERDTPAALSSWLKPVSEKFLGLTGPAARVRDIAAQFTAAFYKTPGKRPGDYLVEHNSQIFLLDSRGQLRATFFNAPVKTMASVTRSIVAERDSRSGMKAAAR